MFEKSLARLRIVGEHEIAGEFANLSTAFAAAMDDLRGRCDVCRYVASKVCSNCIRKVGIFPDPDAVDNWEWRGLKEYFND